MRLTNEELQTAIDNALAKKIDFRELREDDYNLNNHIESLLAEQRSRLYEQPTEDEDA
jgi:hypothetical protein